MDPLKVSIIIPTYNRADYLAGTVQCLLDQTYSNFELIVINDASTDHTDQVMNQFDDPRIRYLVHKENRYAAAARNTGIRASTGDLLAFVDSDDLSHPDKLKLQAAFLEDNPDIGLNYSSRLSIDTHGNPLAITMAPSEVTLSDLVTGFPFAPSETVMRKEWAVRVGLFDEDFVFPGEDPDFFMRLALQGCKMSGLDRVLNYRRRHAGRVAQNLPEIMANEIRAFDNTFSDPRCPSEVLALRSKSMSMLYEIFCYAAFDQGETDMGRELLREAVALDPSILEDEGIKFLTFLRNASIQDGGDHEELLRRVFDQMPSEFAWLTNYANATIAQGYLYRAFRDIMWNRQEEGSAHFAKAAELGAYVDKPCLHNLGTELMSYSNEFGADAARDVLLGLSPYLENIGGRSSVRWLEGYCMINHAFRYYRHHDYEKATSAILRAVKSDPTYLSNNGAMSMFARSILLSLRR